MNMLLKIVLGVTAVAVVLVLWISSSEEFQTKVMLKRQEKMGQGTLEERQAHCAKAGTFSDPVPYSAHLTVHYPVTPQACYRKEPDLAPKTNTICVQKLDGVEITPIFRIIKKYNYTEAGWASFKSQLKMKNERCQLPRCLAPEGQAIHTGRSGDCCVQLTDERAMSGLSAGSYRLELVASSMDYRLWTMDCAGYG